MNRTNTITLSADTSGLDQGLAALGNAFDQIAAQAAAMGQALTSFSAQFRDQDTAADQVYWQGIVANAQGAYGQIGLLGRQSAQQSTQFDALVASSASQNLVKMLQGRESFVAAAENLGDRLLQRGLQNILKSSLAWIEGEAQQTTSTGAGIAARSALQAGGAATTRGINSATASQGIMAKAADAAAGAYSALAAIPIVGPVLGAAAAAATFAAVAAYGSLFSAEGGWDRVPFDNALTSLHKDEMVLSAPYANVIRGLTSGGTASPGVTAHFHAAAGMPAMTHTEFKRFVSANMDYIMGEAGNRYRNSAKKPW